MGTKERREGGRERSGKGTKKDVETKELGRKGKKWLRNVGEGMRTERGTKKREGEKWKRKKTKERNEGLRRNGLRKKDEERESEKK